MSLIKDIVKYATMVLAAINAVLCLYYLIHDGFIEKVMSNEEIIYMLIMTIVFVIGVYAAHIGDVMYLVIFGIVILVGLAADFLAKFESKIMGEAAMIILACLSFAYAFIVKRGDI